MGGLDAPPICAGDLSTPGFLERRLAALGDPEGARLPESLPPVVDAHVHLFPDRVAAAIRQWFDTYGWPIRYALTSPAVLEFLFSRGVARVVGLLYAHKPGIARSMNAYMASLAADPRVIGLGTVFPGEPDAAEVLAEAFASGLRGVKLHCHVQCFAPDSPDMDVIYRACVEADRPLVIHAGREPKSPGYRCDPHRLCHVDRVERVLRAHPRLRLCVPHLGADEFAGYERLLSRYDTLWLDTTMVAGAYFPGDAPWERLARARPDRVMYGTDFPNIPYAWDREIGRIAARLPEDVLVRVLGGTATALYAPNAAEAR